MAKTRAPYTPCKLYVDGADGIAVGDYITTGRFRLPGADASTEPYTARAQAHGLPALADRRGAASRAVLPTDLVQEMRSTSHG